MNASGDGTGTIWVIDAYNVVGARPDGWWRDRAGALADLCDAATSWRPATDRVIVLVDGWPGDAVPEHHGREVEVRYARRRGPDGADDAIVELLHASDDLAATRVVTSDARLRERVIAAGGDVVGAGTFRGWLDRREPTAAPRPAAGETRTARADNQIVGDG